jgi:hypothetical protein
MAKKVQIKLDGDFKDIIISALRYALPRHTYIVDSTCSWIEAHPFLLDSRMVGIMKQDVRKQLKHYQNIGVDSITEMDYNRLKAFYMWLEDIFNE